MTQAEWIDDAAMRLGERMLDISPQAAAAIATELWHEIPGHSMAPKEAADIYASEAPPNDPGAPGDS